MNNLSSKIFLLICCFLGISGFVGPFFFLNVGKVGIKDPFSFSLSFSLSFIFSSYLLFLFSALKLYEINKSNGTISSWELRKYFLCFLISFIGISLAILASIPIVLLSNKWADWVLSPLLDPIIEKFGELLGVPVKGLIKNINPSWLGVILALVIALPLWGLFLMFIIGPIILGLFFLLVMCLMFLSLFPIYLGLFIWENSLIIRQNMRKLVQSVSYFLRDIFTIDNSTELIDSETNQQNLENLVRHANEIQEMKNELFSDQSSKEKKEVFLKLSNLQRKIKFFYYLQNVFILLSGVGGILGVEQNKVYGYLGGIGTIIAFVAHQQKKRLQKEKEKLERKLENESESFLNYYQNVKPFYQRLVENFKRFEGLPSLYPTKSIKVNKSFKKFLKFAGSLLNEVTISDNYNNQLEPEEKLHFVQKFWSNWEEYQISEITSDLAKSVNNYQKELEENNQNFRSSMETISSYHTALEENFEQHQLQIVVQRN